MADNSSNWYVPNEGNFSPSSHTYGGGGGLYTRQAAQFRNPLDARRSMAKEGQQGYPDGYLGSMSWDRRQDKLLNELGNQLNKKPYQRGVHKGSKIGVQDYFWPTDFQPDMRLRAEAKYTQTTPYTMDVKRMVFRGSPIERLAHMGKLTGAAGAPQQENEARSYSVNSGMNPVVPIDPDVKARLVHILPSYRI